MKRILTILFCLIISLGAMAQGHSPANHPTTIYSGKWYVYGYGWAQFDSGYINPHITLAQSISSFKGFAGSRLVIQDSIYNTASTFDWYPDSLTVDSGVVYNAFSGGRWVRQYIGAVHARWFSNLKSNDSTNAGVNSYELRKIFSLYKNVTLDAGDNFYVQDSLTVPLDSTIITGNGGRFVQKVADSSNAIIYVTGKHVTINGLNILGSTGLNGTANYAKGNCGIQVMADSCTISNCIIKKQSGIISRSANYLTVRYCDIYYTQKGVFAWADSAAFIRGVTYDHVNCSTIQGVANNDEVRGLKTQNAFDVDITNCRSFGAQLSIELFNSYPADSSGSNNIIGNTVDTWISAVTGSANIVGNVVDYAYRPTYHADSIIGSINNIIGIEIVGARNFSVMGNTIRNLPGEAIFASFVNQAGILPENQTRNGTISGNTFYNDGDSVNYYKGAITVGNAKNLNITGNQGTRILGNFIGVGGTSSTYVQNIQISNNQVDTCYGRGILTYYSKDVQISNNTLKRVHLEGITIGIANCIRTIVNNNIILDGDTCAIAISGAAFDYQVTGNLMKGNSKNYKNNPQYVIDGSAIGRFYNNFGTDLVTYANFNTPTTGTFWAGEEFYTQPNVTSTLNGKIVTVSGTEGTLGSTTGSIALGDSLLTINAKADKISPNEFITISGVTGTFEIVSVSDDGLTLKLNGVSDATVSGATVQFSPPTFIDKVSDNYIVRGGIEEGATEDFNNLPNYSFLKSIANTNINAPIGDGEYWFVYNNRHRMGVGDGTQYDAQIAIPFVGTSMYFRTQNVGTYDAWKHVPYYLDSLTVSNATGEQHTYGDINAYISQSGQAKWAAEVKNYTFLTTGTGSRYFIKYQLAGVDKLTFASDDGSIVTQGSATVKTIGNGSAGTDSLLTESNGLIGKISPSTYVTAIDSPEHTYAGTLTWDGTPPTTIAAETYRWRKSGTIVYFRIAISYTNAGATNTTVTFPFPADMPSPEEPTGFTSTNDFEASVTGLIGTSTGATNVAFRAFIYKVGTGSYGFKIVGGGTMSAKTVWVWGSYFVP